MRIIALVIATSAVLAGMPASALEPAGDVRMVPMRDGFLEIDAQTGAVRECRREVDGYGCSVVSQDRDPVQAEIERLAKENADLRERLARLGDGHRVKSPPATKPPSDDDVDRALGIMEKFIRRLLSILREETPTARKLFVSRPQNSGSDAKLLAGCSVSPLCRTPPS